MPKFDKNKKIKTKRFILKQFKLSVSLREYAAGSVITLKCNKVSGTPIDRYWRKRLIESEIDGCMVEVIQPKKPKKVKKVEPDTSSPE
jgi:hypothetical protein